MNKDFKNYHDRVLNTEVFSYTLNEWLFSMFSQNTSFIKKSLSRTREDVKKLHRDSKCTIYTEGNYCGVCRLKLFKVDYEKYAMVSNIN